MTCPHNRYGQAGQHACMAPPQPTPRHAPACPEQALGAEFEIDFLNLSYTRTAEDVREARR